MYHPKELGYVLAPASWFYSLFLHTSERHNKFDYLSQLEVSFLSDSGASISVPEHPTCVTIAKFLNITKKHHTLLFQNTNSC